MKKVYFVRDGESEDDAQEVHQRLTTPLSPDGRLQAALLAGRLSHTPFDLIISSPLDRAVETAETIRELTHKPIEVDDLFSEVKKPSILEGQQREDPQFDDLRKILYEKWSYPAWHYADEENFVEVKRRAISVLSVLGKKEEEQIVVVTHGHFLTMLFLVMAFGKLVTADEYQLFDAFSHTDNGSMSLCEFNGEKWKMKTWNDVIHLTELIH